MKSENIGLKSKVNLLEKEKAELEKRNRELEIKVLELEYIKRQHDQCKYKTKNITLFSSAFISFLKEIKVCKG